MPWAKGQSGNPSGAKPETVEVRAVRRLAQEKTKRAFDIVLLLMEAADKDSVRLAAALAILKIAGVKMDGQVTVNLPPGSMTPMTSPFSGTPTAKLLLMRPGEKNSGDGEN